MISKTMLAFVYNIRLILAFCFLSLMTEAQMTKVHGIVTDATNGQPIAFANVVFKTTNIGTLTDDNGSYFIETRNAGDSLTFMILGYIAQRVKVKKNIYQEINIKLVPSNTLMD